MPKRRFELFRITAWIEPEGVNFLAFVVCENASLLMDDLVDPASRRKQKGVWRGATTFR